MRAIFIADAHLVSPEDNNYRLLLQFLREQEGMVDTLYIMGDLFDFWVGFPSNPFRQYDPIIEALGGLVEKGCRIVYFEGNHDFHLGPVFSERLRAEIHSEPSIELIQGQKLYLCHGDQINREDSCYRLLRGVLRSGIVSASVNHLPPAWGEKIREMLQKRSRSGYAAKRARWDYRQILLDHLKKTSNYGCNGMITGHFHLALYERLPADNQLLISLGDWIDQFTYAEMKDGDLRLCRYNVPAESSEAAITS